MKGNAERELAAFLYIVNEIKGQTRRYTFSVYVPLKFVINAIAALEP